MPSNAFGLPDDELDRIRLRDLTCVYCHKTMFPYGSESSRTDWATIEHLSNDPPWDDPATIAICCVSCNSSRAKELSEWFESEYCRSRGIDKTTVAEPGKKHLRSLEP